MNFFGNFLGYYRVENHQLKEESWREAVHQNFKEFKRQVPKSASRSLNDDIRYFRKSDILVSLFSGSYILQLGSDEITFLPGLLRRLFGVALLVVLAVAVIASAGMVIDSSVPAYLVFTAILSVFLMLSLIVFAHRKITLALYRRDIESFHPS